MKLFNSIALLAAFILAAGSIRADETVPLAGQWRFEIAGADAHAFDRELTGKIRLPGTMDDAGLGPKNTKAPTLEGPYRLYNYAGPAWYQRDVEIPATWTGKRVTLTLERVRWVTSVWLDGKAFGTQDSLIAPHVYDFGTGVTPGKHRLTICVDNTVKIDLGPFVSALFGGTWGNMNGIVGKIELSATPPVWIADVQVYPDVDKQTARVAVRIGNATGKPGKATLIAGSQSVEAAWDEKGGHTELTVDMGRAKLWDEFAPNLTELTVKLGDAQRTVRFGMRKFEARGTRFAMNGRPVFLRGTLECSVFPLTGYPPTDPAEWHRIFKIMKSYGLNFVRFHSWCPPEAAFEAADLEGIMIQAEGPMANVSAGSNRDRDQFIEAEFRRMVDTYGNHPSFCLMTLGNEYGGADELLTRWVQMLIERDPRHLYSSASCAQVTKNRQWTEKAEGRGIHGPGTERDLHSVVAGDPRPIVGHEIGQWMFFPDFKERKKYTGVMAVKNFDLIEADLEKKHLLDLAPKFVDASGKFAVALYKEEVEVLLRTPEYAGFSLLDLHDYPTQGTALIGPLDPFWDSKGFITPEAFRRFCGPTVPLLRIAKRTYTAGEALEGTVDLANYGPANLPNAQAVWTIKNLQGQAIASGTLPLANAPTGTLTALGKFQAPLTAASAPVKAIVTVALQGTQFSNDWEIWIYPGDVQPKAPEGVAVYNTWEETQPVLERGGKAILFAKTGGASLSMRGAFLPVFWSPVWFPSQKPNTMGLLCDPEHPIFAHFPTESHSNWQWHSLMQSSRLFVLDNTPSDYRPALQVIDNFARNHKLGVIFEARVGKGQLLVCGIDLPSMKKDPAARQLLASVYNYAGSSAFHPQQEIAASLLEDMLLPKTSSVLEKLGAVIRADSEVGDHSAANAIDGNTETIWHTPWTGNAPGFPHSLTVSLEKPVKLQGVSCLPRQDGIPNGTIKNCVVWISDDGNTWREIARAEFKRGDALKIISFQQAVETKWLKIVALDSFDMTKPYASLAELDVIPAK